MDWDHRIKSKAEYAAERKAYTLELIGKQHPKTTPPKKWVLEIYGDDVNQLNAGIHTRSFEYIDHNKVVTQSTGGVAVHFRGQMIDGAPRLVLANDPKAREGLKRVKRFVGHYAGTEPTKPSFPSLTIIMHDIPEGERIAALEAIGITQQTIDCRNRGKQPTQFKVSAKGRLQEIESPFVSTPALPPVDSITDGEDPGFAARVPKKKRSTEGELFPEFEWRKRHSEKDKEEWYRR